MANTQGQFYSSLYESNRTVVDVHNKIFMLSPGATPFLTFQSKLDSDPTGNPEVRWFEDTHLSWTDTAKSAAAADATTVYVDEPDRYAVGHVVMNVTTNEHMVVTSVVSASDYVLVTRGFGETATATVLAADTFLILGTASLEGDTSQGGLITTKSQVYNYTQMFRWPYEMTKLAAGTSTRTGSPWPYESKFAADEHKLQIERQLLFGERAVAYSSGKKRFQTRGLKYYVTSANQFNVAGVLPEFDFDDWIRAVFRDGTGDSVSTTKVLLANDRLLAIINRFAKVKQNTTANDTKYGVNITNYFTPHGTVKLVHHRLLDKAYSSTGYGLLYDPANVDLRYFMGPDYDGHTKLYTNIQANDAETRKDEYRTTVGLEVRHATTHGEILNVTG